MTKKKIILVVFAFCYLTNLKAQNLEIFDLKYIEKDSIHSFGFISLSEIHHLSEHPDSLATPDFSNIEIEEAPNYEYIELDSSYRKRFLSATHISETDKVFLYDYSVNSLLKFTVKNLKAVACLNYYGGDWPYSQNEYMIGFEIEKKYLTAFDKYYCNAIVSIGKKNPFIRGKVKQVTWIKIQPSDFPSKEIPNYDSAYTGKCITGDAYKFELEGLQYFLQELVRVTDQSVQAKRLIVIDFKTKKTICEKYFYSGEGASFAPMENQWTGKLFKNKPSVIFGFHYVSFGCPYFTFLNSSESDLYIKCDNRH